MKVALSWLEDHLGAKASLAEIVETPTGDRATDRRPRNRRAGKIEGEFTIVQFGQTS